jgi:hypothetical protein
LPGKLALVERRQELPLGEVAGAAEDDEIEGLDGDGLAGHDLSICMALAAAMPCL